MPVRKQRKVNKEFLLLIALFALSVCVRFALADYTKVCRIYGDEMRYYGIAKSIALQGDVLIRNATTDYQKIAYSVLLAPLFAIGSVSARIKAIALLNSAVMSASAFPVWGIGGELGLSKKSRFLLCFITLLWPDMVFTGSFMSEVFFWPLFMTVFYLWLYNQRKGSYVLSLFLGVLSYWGYVCKEFFLVVAMAYAAMEILFPLTEWLLSLRKEKTKLREHLSKQAFIHLGLFLFAFCLSHVIFKQALFPGLGNSYHQTGISAMLHPYNFLYMIYAFFYYMAALCLSVFVFPFVLPVLHYESFEKKEKRFFLLILFYLLISALIVAYSISIREDLGEVIPRLHLRYTGPATVLLFCPFFLCFREKAGALSLSGKRFGWELSGAILVLIVLLFKGEPFKVCDQFSLCWYSLIQRASSVLHFEEDSVSFYPYALFTGLAVCAVTVALFFLYSRSKRRMLLSYTALVIAACLVSNAVGQGYLYDYLHIESDEAEDVVLLNDYFTAEDPDADILYITSETGQNESSRIFDTYFDDISHLYIITQSELLAYKEAGTDDVADMQFYEPIYHCDYVMPEGFDYIIIEDSLNWGVENFENCDYLEELDTPYYDVYKCADETSIDFAIDESSVFSGETFILDFTDADYNADRYISNGLSVCEGDFSWTEGNELNVSLPVAEGIETVRCTFSVRETFHGTQRYSIRQNGEVIAEGSLDGAGEVSFVAQVTGGYLSFSVEMPDAAVVSKVDPNSPDGRCLALQLTKCTITKD